MQYLARAIGATIVAPATLRAILQLKSIKS